MFPELICVSLILCFLQTKATVLPSCSSVLDVRSAIGCFNTDETLLTPVAKFTYASGYVAVPVVNVINTLERFCALQCLLVGTPYYVLYNDSTCACVSVSGSLTLINSSSCLTTCPNTTISGSMYCPTSTPSAGAYWFCTPKSSCNTSEVKYGNDVGWTKCSYPKLDAVLEGEFVRSRGFTKTNCLQQRTLFQCVRGNWTSLGQSSISVCQPCSQSPTTCSPLDPCSPTIPYGTCVPASITTTTATAVVTTTTGQVLNSSVQSADNLPWNGGNANPLPSQNLYMLVNLTNYNPSDRPTDRKGLQTLVSVALIVQNIDSVSELSSSFDLDMFFYLSWMDRRLEFNDLPIVGPPGSFFQFAEVREQRELWIPPVYVGNVKATDKIDTSRHTSVVFLNSDGQASHMYRSFVTAECKMNLQNYPFDTQICPIYLGLFGYYDGQVQLNWAISSQFNMSNPSTPFSLNDKITLSAWTVVGYSTSLPQLISNTNAVCAKFRSCLLATVELRRKSSFYIIDTFLPNIIIMAGSCFTLWINPENVPARVSMAVTLFLTFQATSLNVRSKLPSVTYVKAIDIWLLFGQGCLFCVMAEFLVVHMILNGYVNVSNWRICAMCRSNSKAVQTEAFFISRARSEQFSRQKASQKIEKYARVLFPTIIILFAIVYFSVYLSQ